MLLGIVLARRLLLRSLACVIIVVLLRVPRSAAVAVAAARAITAAETTEDIASAHGHLRLRLHGGLGLGGLDVRAGQRGILSTNVKMRVEGDDIQAGRRRGRSAPTSPWPWAPAWWAPGRLWMEALLRVFGSRMLIVDRAQLRLVDQKMMGDFRMRYGVSREEKE